MISYFPPFQIEFIRNTRMTGGQTSSRQDRGEKECPKKKKKLVKKVPKKGANDSAFFEESLKLSPTPKRRQKKKPNVDHKKSCASPMTKKNPPPEEKEYIDTDDLDLFDTSQEQDSHGFDGFMHDDNAHPGDEHTKEAGKPARFDDNVDRDTEGLLLVDESAEPVRNEDFISTPVDAVVHEVSPSPDDISKKAHDGSSSADEKSNHSADDEHESEEDREENDEGEDEGDSHEEKSDEEEEEIEEHEEEHEDKEENENEESGDGDESEHHQEEQQDPEKTGDKQVTSDEDGDEQPELPLTTNKSRKPAQKKTSAAKSTVRPASTTAPGTRRHVQAMFRERMERSTKSSAKRRKSTVPQLVPRKLFRYGDVRDDGVEVSFAYSMLIRQQEVFVQPSLSS